MSAKTYQRFQANHATYFDSQNSPGWGKSPWQVSPIMAAVSDPAGHVLYREDFLDKTLTANTIPGWTATIATSGTITADTTNPSGGVVISTVAATANQGVNWQMSASSYKIAAGKPLWFEGRLKFTGLTALNIQFFFGLAEQSTALISSGAVATKDRIGFQGVTTTGILNSVARGGGTAVTGTGFTITNNQTYRLGLIATDAAVHFLVDGDVVNTISSQIPAGLLAPAITVQANGTSIPVIGLDYVMVLGARQ